jgi:hypothetical protein
MVTVGGGWRIRFLLRWVRSLATLAAMTAALLVWVEDADARLEGELSAGRSSGVVSPLVAAPAALATAALDQSPAGQPGYPGGSLGGLFNRPGVVGGFAAGFLGAGVFGLLFGEGLFGGLGGPASFLGLIFQLALVGMLARVIWVWWSGRNARAFTGLSPRQQAEAYLRTRNDLLPGSYPSDNADDVAADNEMVTSGSGAGETPMRRDIKK